MRACLERNTYTVQHLDASLNLMADEGDETQTVNGVNENKGIHHIVHHSSIPHLHQLCKYHHPHHLAIFCLSLIGQFQFGILYALFIP